MRARMIMKGNATEPWHREAYKLLKLFLILLAAAALVHSFGFAVVFSDNFFQKSRSKAIPPWEEGYLDIHHLRVGPSESSFLIFPDGTTMMIDAGDIDLPRKLPKLHEQGHKGLKIRPPFPFQNQSTSQWALDYIHHFWPRPQETKRELDFFLLTHFHCDHMGNPGPDSPLTRTGGDYRLSGLTEVAEHLPMAKIVDRGYPNYDFPVPITWDTVANYRKFLQTTHTGKIEQFQVGSNTQFAMTRDLKSPFKDDFRVINLKGNVDVLVSGTSNGTIEKIPGQVFTNPEKQKWNENEMSTAIRIDYGAFRYYEGGDQEAHSDSNGELDTITPTAKVAGKVDVATANHHGRGTNQAYCDELDPQIVILQGLFSDQPLVETMEFLTQPRKSKDNNNQLQKRTLLVTDVFPERLKIIGKTHANAFAAMNGHVVVRVSRPGPDQHYRIFMLDQNKRVKASFGPFKPRRL